MSVFATIVLDGVGIGAQPDAAEYGDEGSHTLGHVCEVMEPHLPHLEELGLGCIEPLKGVEPAANPRAHYGKMREVSAGKDSTTGHWELAGLRLNEPFPTYPEGFPAEVIDRFVRKTSCEGVLGNVPESGTVIIERHGREHMRTGHPIVYTSADSVFQIAAHKDVISLSGLYELCEIARNKVCTGKHNVGRVIARPFVGTPGAFERISAERKDFASLPKSPPVQDVLQQNDVYTVSIGKVADLFGRVGFDEMIKTRTNARGIEETIHHLQQHTPDAPNRFIWTNLIDFDQEYGHRNDPAGFAEALEEFDRKLPDIIAALPDGGELVITADHGNDPTTDGTDHNREYVPLLYLEGETGSPRRDLNLRRSFNDHAATVADYFGVYFETQGTPFLPS